MQKIALTALISAALVTPFIAHAEDYYAKAAIGQSHYKDFQSGFPGQDATGGSIGLGYAINKNWDAEIGYTYFGNMNEASVNLHETLKTHTLYGAGIGKLAINEAFSLYGKAGIAFNYSKYSATTPTGSVSLSKTNTALLLGAGLSYQITKELAAFIDYTHYGSGKVDDRATEFKLDQVSLGLKYNF